MIWRIVIFLFLFSLAPASYAEYYLVYGGGCGSCVSNIEWEYYPYKHKHRYHRAYPKKHTYHRKHYVKYHRVRSPIIEVYYPYPAMGCYSCGCQTVVYTSRPTDCVTYENVIYGSGP